MERERLQHVQECKTLVPSVQSYCFQLLNIRVCDVLVMVLAVAWAPKWSSPWWPEIESGVTIFFILCSECLLWYLFAGDNWSQWLSYVALFSSRFLYERWLLKIQAKDWGDAWQSNNMLALWKKSSHGKCGILTICAVNYPQSLTGCDK